MGYPTVQNVMDDARVLLNDTASVIFTNTALIPIVKKVYQELQDEFLLNGAPAQKSVYQAPVISAGSTTYDPIFTLSAQGFLWPITVEEKGPTEANDFYREIIEEDWDVNVEFFLAQPTLTRWCWRNNTIYFTPAQVDRVIRIEFASLYTQISVAGDSIKAANAQVFLASRTAAVAAFVIGGNEERASSLQGDAEVALDRTLGQVIKSFQGRPTRRQPFKAFK